MNGPNKLEYLSQTNFCSFVKYNTLAYFVPLSVKKKKKFNSIDEQVEKIIQVTMFTKLFSLSLTKELNKLECLSLTDLSWLV